MEFAGRNFHSVRGHITLPGLQFFSSKFYLHSGFELKAGWAQSPSGGDFSCSQGSFVLPLIPGVDILLQLQEGHEQNCRRNPTCLTVQGLLPLPELCPQHWKHKNKTGLTPACSLPHPPGEKAAFVSPQTRETCVQ